jgi:2-keto-4-pentenoate hydratase/2-oxohepta-3-ene-1,7-dioic acid hydratase in catechol pathway
MMMYRFEQNEPPLAIGKIICLARTYRKHAEEMKSAPPPNPILFLKPASAVIFSGGTIYYPYQSNCVHHEVEVGVVIGKKARNISRQNALDVVKGYLVGLDITARDIQTIAKREGWPWSISKGFDTFAPISNVVSSENVSNPCDISFRLWVNSELCQQGNTSQLIWDIETLISFISSIMTLEPGDLILTGTPEGVSEIQVDDKITAELTGLINLGVTVKRAKKSSED